MSGKNLVKLLGKQVELNGKALNAKAGALLSFEGGMVFIDKLEAWPEEIRDQEVTVKGTLVKKQVFPETFVTEDGLVSQGVAFGSPPPFVFEGAQWRLAKGGPWHNTNEDPEIVLVATIIDISEGDSHDKIDLKIESPAEFKDNVIDIFDERDKSKVWRKKGSRITFKMKRSDLRTYPRHTYKAIDPKLVEM